MKLKDCTLTKAELKHLCVFPLSSYSMWQFKLNKGQKGQYLIDLGGLTFFFFFFLLYILPLVGLIPWFYSLWLGTMFFTTQKITIESKMFQINSNVRVCVSINGYVWGTPVVADTEATKVTCAPLSVPKHNDHSHYKELSHVSEPTVLLHLGHFKGQQGLQPKRQIQGAVNHCRQSLPSFYHHNLVLLIYSAPVILICNRAYGFWRKYILLKMHSTTLMHGMFFHLANVFKYRMHH